MAYTVRKLITKAYFLSGIVSRTFEEVAGELLFDGLDLLNNLLAFKAADQRLLPYFEEYDFDAIVGQEKYFIANLLYIGSVTFNIDVVRFPTNKINRDAYFGAPRADDIESLPFNWHAERVKGGTDLYLYFIPGDTYPMKVWGKFGLDEITSQDFDLSTVYDLFYLEYLRFALAEYICTEFNVAFQPQALSKLKQMEEMITDVSPYDLRLKKASTLEKDIGINYADINIGKGWEP